jgi:hypothetical protein
MVTASETIESEEMPWLRGRLDQYQAQLRDLTTLMLSIQEKLGAMPPPTLDTMTPTQEAILPEAMEVTETETVLPVESPEDAAALVKKLNETPPPADDQPSVNAKAVGRVRRRLRRL